MFLLFSLFSIFLFISLTHYAFFLSANKQSGYILEMYYILQRGLIFSYIYIKTERQVLVKYCPDINLIKNIYSRQWFCSLPDQAAERSQADTCLLGLGSGADTGGCIGAYAPPGHSRECWFTPCGSGIKSESIKIRNSFQYNLIKIDISNIFYKDFRAHKDP